MIRKYFHYITIILKNCFLEMICSPVLTWLNRSHSLTYVCQYITYIIKSLLPPRKLNLEIKSLIPPGKLNLSRLHLVEPNKAYRSLVVLSYFSQLIKLFLKGY